METLTATLALAAIVTQNQVALKAAPTESSAQHAVLTQGDLLEIRGRKLDHLQVYDHRRERSGYVLAARVHTTTLSTNDAVALGTLLHFVREQPGQEALTISLAQAQLKAFSTVKSRQPAQAETLVILGEAAHRLIGRVQRKSANDLAHAQLEGARYLGVKTLSFERNGEQQLCYAGDAFMHALQLPSTALVQARAALGLTRHDCVDPALRVSERRALDEARLATIQKIDTADNSLSELMRNHLRLREASVRAALAFADAGAGSTKTEHATRAIELLASVNKTELTDELRAEYHETALRVGAVRWAAVPISTRVERNGLTVTTKAGEPGQTCVHASDAKGFIGTRCTFGHVWLASLAISAQGTIATLAVQPSATWREMWVLRREANAWVIDVLPPASSLQEVGLVEFAGFSGSQILVARETTDKGRISSSFEKISATTLNTELRASTPSLIAAFGRSQDSGWKAQTLTLR